MHMKDNSTFTERKGAQESSEIPFFTLKTRVFRLFVKISFFPAFLQGNLAQIILHTAMKTCNFKPFIFP